MAEEKVANSVFHEVSVPFGIDTKALNAEDLTHISHKSWKTLNGFNPYCIPAAEKKLHPNVNYATLFAANYVKQ